MSMWSQNIEDYLKNAIANHTINDWMVAVSPSISHEYVFVDKPVPINIYNHMLLYLFLDFGQIFVMHMQDN